MNNLFHVDLAAIFVLICKCRNQYNSEVVHQLDTTKNELFIVNFFLAFYELVCMYRIKQRLRSIIHSSIQANLN